MQTASARVFRLTGVSGLLLLGAVGIFLLGTSAVLFRPADAAVAYWWPAAALSAALVLRSPGWRLRGASLAVVVVSSGLANVAGGRSMAVSTLFGLGNALEAALVAGLLDPRATGRARLASVRDLLLLVAAAAVGALTLGLVAGSVVQVLLGGELVPVWGAAAASHASAVLLLLPFVLDHPAPGDTGWAERAGQAVVLGALLAVAFSPRQQLQVDFLPLVALVWTALRAGGPWLHAQLLALAVVAGWATASGYGPFSHLDPATTSVTQLQLTQLFIMVSVLLVLAVATSVAERRAALDSLARLSTSDTLTGLGNRRHLESRLEEALARAGRGEPATLMLLDLDGFKPVNDLFGHDAGDQVLREVAERLRAATREVDTVVRLGGDEFVVLCPGLRAGSTPERELRARLEQAVTAPYRLPGAEVVVGASIGAAEVLVGLSHVDLMRAADTAMYAVKAGHRGRGAGVSSGRTAPAPRSGRAQDAVDAGSAAPR